MSVPCTAKEIQEKVEMDVTERFVQFSVPELFFWSIGLEYLGGDGVEFKI